MFKSKFNRLFHQIINEDIDLSAFEKKFNFRLKGRLSTITDPETVKQLLNEALQLNLEILEKSMNTQEPIEAFTFDQTTLPYVIVTKIENEKIYWKFDLNHIKENVAALNQSRNLNPNRQSSFFGQARVNQYNPKSDQENISNAFNFVTKAAYDFIQTKRREIIQQKHDEENTRAINAQNERKAKDQAAREMIAKYMPDIKQIETQLKTKFNCNCIYTLSRPNRGIALTPEAIEYLKTIDTTLLKAYFNYVYVEVTKAANAIGSGLMYADGQNYYDERNQCYAIHDNLDAFIKYVKTTFNL